MKAKYNKPDSVKQLERIANREARNKYPGTPPHLLAPRKYRDDKANDLTKCIIHYIRFSGGFATRLNSTGVFRADLGKFVRNTQRKGLPDVQGVYNGIPLFIEVKIGRDRLSVHQEKIQNEVEGSGGLYFIAKDFTTFKNWFDEIAE